MVTGTPWSGPNAAPADRAASAASGGGRRSVTEVDDDGVHLGVHRADALETSAITSAQVKSPRSYPSISSVAGRFQRSMRPGS